MPVYIVEQPAIAVTCVGGSGVATGTTNSLDPLTGTISHIYVTYTSAPATTVITVKSVGGPGGTSRTLFALAAGNTSGFFYPRNSILTAAGAAITDGSAEIAVGGRYLSVIVTLADAATVVTVHLVTKHI